MIDKIRIEDIITISKKAGEAIMDVYSKDFEVEIKADNSPLTIADQRASDIIEKDLLRLYPDIPVISEENKHAPYEERKNWAYFWLVDPLDGTKEFVKRNGEFTVNIALMHKNLPVLGVIYVPVKDETYYAISGKGSYSVINKEKSKLSVRDENSSYVIVSSRSHPSEETIAYIKEKELIHGEINQIAAGSSLKFCLVASGKANVYPRFGPTMEWDTAAGHIIVKEAGGSVTDKGQELLYNKEDLRNPSLIISA